MQTTKSAIESSELVEYLENAWNIDKDDEDYDNYIDTEWVEYAIREADLAWEGEDYYAIHVGYTTWEPTYIWDQLDLASMIYSAYMSTYGNELDVIWATKVA